MTREAIFNILVYLTYYNKNELYLHPLGLMSRKLLSETKFKRIGRFILTNNTIYGFMTICKYPMRNYGNYV